jgi:hypothetical protein
MSSPNFDQHPDDFLAEVLRIKMSLEQIKPKPLTEEDLRLMNSKSYHNPFEVHVYTTDATTIHDGMFAREVVAQIHAEKVEPVSINSDHCYSEDYSAASRHAFGIGTIYVAKHPAGPFEEIRSVLNSDDLWLDEEVIVDTETFVEEQQRVDGSNPLPVPADEYQHLYNDDVFIFEVQNGFMTTYRLCVPKNRFLPVTGPNDWYYRMETYEASQLGLVGNCYPGIERLRDTHVFGCHASLEESLNVLDVVSSKDHYYFVRNVI